VEGTSESVCEWIENGKVALGIIQLPCGTGHFDERLLMTERFVLLAKPSHPIAKRSSVSLATLAKEPFVFYKGRARDSALAACREAGFQPRIACESGELEAVHALVAAGLGLAILPELAARRGSPDCALIRISKPRIERQIALLQRRGQQLSPAAAAFEKLLRTKG
jgi:DNA-binding transcriptional LysR family regulator